jgi:hypothetical protein
MGGSNPSTYVGKLGEIFYNPASGSLRISDGHTAGGNAIAIESVHEVYDEDLIPSLDNTYSLGSELLRWKEVHIGPGTLYIQDQNNAGLNAALTVVDGVLKIDGANQIQVGQLKFVNNTIESTTDTEDIQIGLLTSSANLVLNRNVIMGEGKTFNTTGLTSLDPTADITLGASSDTGQLVTYRKIVLKDGNDNVILQFTTDETGQGKIVYGGGSTGITMGDGLAINGIGYQDYTSGSQVLSYATSTGKVTYGQIKYEGILGFPRLPNYANDTAANTAAGTPLKGMQYYNTTTDKAMVYTASGWQAMN